MGNSVHVYHAQKGWAVRRPGALRVIAYYPERRDAIARARDYLIRRGGGSYYVHRKGRIERREKVSTTNIASEAKPVVSDAFTEENNDA